MLIYNTLTRKKEELKPKKLNLFVCGPTVYGYSHIGHAKTYIAFDVIVKYLKSAGYKVTYLQNITDIDDKIIRQAQKENKDVKELARFFEKEYLKDMKELGVTAVDIYARATDYIKEIILQIERLFKKGYAYQIEDGIYYDITKFKDYGKLSGRTTQGAEDAVSRIDESINKKNKGDFVLWKFSKENEPEWKSPWGKGRPGWHIEDTAITEKHFGYQYDMHGGARDLLFPHHEAEIAQMEAISEKAPMAKYWLHTGFLTVRGDKMSKSRDNFITIQDFLNKHSVRLLRFLILKSHYRSPLDYTEELLKQTEKELERIDEFVSKLQEARSKNSAQEILSKAKTSFKKAMEDDFNTPQALGVLFELIKKGNILLSQQKMNKKEANAILTFFDNIEEVFGCVLQKQRVSTPKEIQQLAQEREKHRIQKDWGKADALRKQIQRLGWEVEDTEKGPKIHKN